MKRVALPLMLLLWLGAASAASAAGPAEPPASCSSDGQRAPTALLERFVNADCADCWRDEPPAPAADAVALDWIAPGPLGDDGPLSAAARRDSLKRLEALGRPLPEATLALGRAVRAVPAGKAPLLRVAHGLPLGNYIGTSIEMRGAPPGQWRVWLLLVEELPPGLEGSPIARSLVRNTLQLDWTVPQDAARSPSFKELRPMQIPAGAQGERLSVVGFVEDASGPPGQLAVIARSSCGPGQ